MGSASVVMRGSLDDFELIDVLQCVGVSRQYTVIELRNGDGSSCGQIGMKSGHVLEVRHLDRQGRSAFVNLFNDAPAGFTVRRLDDQSAYPAPIATLSSLILEALERSRDEVTQVDPPPTRSRASEPRTQPVRIVTLHAELPRQVNPAKKPAQKTEHQPTPRSPSSKQGIAVAVASPKGGAGKTTISLNLALSLAERGLRTVLVDGDINGDLLSLINARGKAKRGAYDYLDNPSRVSEALRRTKSKFLRILPASGVEVPLSGVDHRNHDRGWKEIVDRLRVISDVVLIDCPAGMFHATRPLLCASTHALGVFQSEIVAQRSFDMFIAGLDSIAEADRPEALGVVVNMFNGRGVTSLEAFHGLCLDGDRHRLFETIIPRSDAFLSASASGAPLRVSGDAAAADVAWLFDSLAAELCNRVGRNEAIADDAPFMMA